jgi:hypothetical protein
MTLIKIVATVLAAAAISTAVIIAAHLMAMEVVR